MANYIIPTTYFLLWLGINFSAGSDICSTSKTPNDKCIPLGECPPLLKLLKERPVPQEHVENLKKAGCGYQGVHPKVCCPLGGSEETTPEPVISTTTTTTSKPIPEPPLSVLLPKLSDCGHFFEDRILMGETAQLDSYPWTVLLEYETPNGNGFHCGGVLINKRYVLTAAHCISGIEDNWKLVNVRLGEYNRETEKDCDSFFFDQNDCCCTDDVIDVEIEEEIVHEKYDPKNKQQYYDIALLRLYQNIRFSDFVRPVCLQPVKDLAEVSTLGKSATISGWGVNKISSNSIKKQWGRMKIRNNTECETAYAKHGLHLREDQLCAFVLNTGNSCSQDSGGAMVNDNRIVRSTINYFAVGVMSIGHPVCGLKEYPVIYTKVENYISWIIDNLKP